MKLRAALFVLVLLVATGSAVVLDVRYAYADFKASADMLLNVSGMVFTIMGIWIAFLYPNALSRLADPQRIRSADFSATLGETRRLEAIVASILKSGLVVVGILTMFFAIVVLRGSSFGAAHWDEFKALALGLLTTLVAMQLDAVASVAYANIMFINDLHGKREARQANEDL